MSSDETSMFSKTYEGFHAVEGSGRIWILGLRQMTTKSGQNALDTLLDILKDINTVSDESENDTSRSILKTKASTMSDRASTQLKFNQLLEDYRL